jgi:hypothetical protein
LTASRNPGTLRFRKEESSMKRKPYIRVVTLSSLFA